MLILCSNGLTSPELIKRVSFAAKECCTAALVITADAVYKGKNHHVPRCRTVLESMGLHVTIFDLDVQPAEHLLAYDVIEFIGGNPFYLLNAIRQCHAEPILRVLASGKILIGWSAAAFVFGPSLELVSRYSPEMNTPGLKDLRGLCLTDFEVLPHYSRFFSKIEGFEQTCCKYEKEFETTVLRLNDGEGLLIQNGIAEICRSSQQKGW